MITFLCLFFCSCYCFGFFIIISTYKSARESTFLPLDVAHFNTLELWRCQSGPPAWSQKSLCRELLACSSDFQQTVFPWASEENYSRLCIRQLVSTRTMVIHLFSPPTPKIQSPERIYCAFHFSLSISLLQIFTCAYEDKIQSCICTSHPIVKACSAAALPSFQIFSLPPSLLPLSVSPLTFQTESVRRNKGAVPKMARP